MLDPWKYLCLVGYGSLKLWHKDRCHNSSQEPWMLALTSTQPSCWNHSGGHFAFSLTQNPETSTHEVLVVGEPPGQAPNAIAIFCIAHFCTHFQPVRTGQRNTVNIVNFDFYISIYIYTCIFRGFQVESCLSEFEKGAAVVLTLRFSHPCQRFEAG